MSATIVIPFHSFSAGDGPEVWKQKEEGREKGGVPIERVF